MAIKPRAEVMERLDSLDWASPVLDQPRVEKFFTEFLKTLAKTHHENGRRSDAAYKFADNTVIQWMPGTHGYQDRMHDLGYWGGSSADFNSAYWQYLSHITREPIRDTDRGLEREPPRPPQAELVLLQNIAAPMLWWLRNQDILRDTNLLKAFLAGLGFFIVQKRVIFLFPRPAIRTRHENNNRLVLHSTIGPAVQFADDPASNQYWLRGVQVRQFVVENPERITRAHIRAARNPQQRRALIEQYGLLKYSIERGFKPRDINEYCGATLYVKGGIRNSYGISQRECIVELVNSTPEPDGTHRHFARRVPGNMQNAHQAVAWTFSFDDPRDYMPIVQT